jgi:predicted transcriptional regulator
MKLRKILELLDCEIITGESYLDREVKYAFGSDLMSDVLAYTEEDTVLLTGLCNNQVIRTAEMLDLNAIVFVRGKCPSEDVVEMAREDDILLLKTDHSMYSASGILYSHGLEGTEI